MQYDLVIIGAGWAGFNAAAKARELGLKVALVEKGPIGGTCLNTGCIPTKTLIHSAKIFSLARKSAAFGIEAQQPTLNFPGIIARKDKIVQQLRSGMKLMLKGIDYLEGQAVIASAQEIRLGGQLIKSDYMLIATGSRPIELPGLKFDGNKILSSDDILDLKELPASLLIIGGGVIGCEFAGLFSSLGTKVTVVELTPQLLPGVDREAARKLEASFKKKGIEVSTETDAKTVDLGKFDLALLCIGRAPNTAGTGLQEAGVELERGRIIVDEYLRTAIPNIYAAGDCTGKTMLAHFAAYQGEIAAGNIKHPDNLKKADNCDIPNCIFTEPQIAAVGLNEEQARAGNFDVRVSKFDLMGSSMARILDEAEGFIKIVFEAGSEKILGACIVGPQACELIGILALAKRQGLTLANIRDTIFAHPTLSESVHEASKISHAG